MDACIFNNSLSILVNRSPTTNFEVERGLRQGDPSSLFIFTLMAKGLCVLFNIGAEFRSFEGYKIGSGMDAKIL